MPDMNYIPGNPEQQPHAPLWFQPLPPKKKHTVRNVLLIVVAGLVALCGVGTIIAATTSSGKAGYQAATQNAALPSSTAEHIKPGQQDPNVAPAKQYAAPTPADFTPTLKVLEKHCFGSAGCNLTFDVDLTYNGSGVKPNSVWDITYDVEGAQDPMTNTLTVTFDATGVHGSYRSSEEMVEIAQHANNPTLKITSVTARS